MRRNGYVVSSRTAKQNDQMTPSGDASKDQSATTKATQKEEQQPPQFHEPRPNVLITPVLTQPWFSDKRNMCDTEVGSISLSGTCAHKTSTDNNRMRHRVQRYSG